jgi:outer membrane protein assembly factor BamB
VYFEGKSGLLYALDRRSGKEIWNADTHPDARGDGGFATPSGDGTILVVNSGGASAHSNATQLVAFDLDGHERYTLTQQQRSTPSLGASFVKGVGFAGIDRTLVAFGALTGKQLWSYASADGFYALPAIASNAVFAVDLSGNVYAFAQHASATASNLVSPLDPPATTSLHRRVLTAAFGFAGVCVVTVGSWLGMKRFRARR